MRLSGLLLVLLIFGFKFVQSFVDSGVQYSKDDPAGLYIFVGLMGLLSVLYLWMASAFGYANQVAIAMVVELFAGMLLRVVTDHVSWWTVLRYGLFVAGALVLAFGNGKTEDELPMTKWRTRNERKALPRINRRREKQGKLPVASFKEHMDDISADKRRQRRVLAWITSPIVVLCVQSTFRDVGNEGKADSVSTAPVAAVVAAAVVVSAFFIAAWWFSTFRYRSIVLGLELIVGAALLIAPRAGWKNSISAWDIVSDVALLVLACAQMHDTTNGQQATARSDAIGS